MLRGDSKSKFSEEDRQRRLAIEKYSSEIYYSPRYSDDGHEYRHVILPKQLAKYVPTDRLMSEAEWRGLGVIQSPGWTHYMVHKPEPHILLFQRDLPK